MLLQTQAQLSAIWLEVDPPARDAFEQLAADHGRGFAELARDLLLADKLVRDNEASIKALRGKP